MGAGGGGDGGGRSAALDRGGPRGGIRGSGGNLPGPSESRGALGRDPGARSAAETDRSALAGFMGLSDRDRQANFNDNAARDARDRAGNRGGGGDYQAQLAAAAAAAEQAKPKPTTFVSTPIAASEPSESAPAPAASAPRPAAAPAMPAFDPAAYMADIQARYDEQLQAIQQEIRAADEARSAQLAELTKQTEERKKKIKKPRNYARLSLLSGSELGIPDQTTLGG